MSEKERLIEKALATPCSRCGQTNKKFYHKGEYMFAARRDRETDKLIWDVKVAHGNVSHDLIACLECAYFEDWADVEKGLKRQELVERAMDDIYANFVDYRKWIMDEMRNVVESWDEKRLREFLGEEEEPV